MVNRSLTSLFENQTTAFHAKGMHLRGMKNLFSLFLLSPFPLFADGLSLIDFPNPSFQFITPAWRGEPNSEQAQWDIFFNASGPNDPFILTSTAEGESCRQDIGDATLRNNTSGAIVTGTLNIYSSTSAISLEINDSSDFPIRNLLLQVGVLGNRVDTEAVFLDLDGNPLTTGDSIQPVAFRMLSEEPIAVGGGEGAPATSFSRSYAFQFEIDPSLTVTNYSLTFRSAGAAMSLDEAVVDTSDTFINVFVEEDEVPELTISQEDSSFSLSWSEESSVVLEATTNLADENSWVEVEIVPMTGNGIKVVTVPAANSPTFFRLSSQSDF